MDLLSKTVRVKILTSKKPRNEIWYLVVFLLFRFMCLILC